ncbi:MAG TPA: Holliday junction branch migration protein RuvA [Candidatus Binataceae bacterium]|nr:Holliday junction branch migration protein RuvA [Candidatus Binataceae bacterium]
MIASISGMLAVRDAGRIIVETGGIGYEVQIPLSTFYRLPALGEQVRLQVRQVVREDALMLYGFAEPLEKRAFDLLMSVQNVGPKLALAILSSLEPAELVAAIGRDDVAALDAVPGVGPKVAERVVRELRDKIDELRLSDGAILNPGAAVRSIRPLDGPATPIEEAISALMNLGVKPIEARRTVDSVVAADPAAATDLQLIVRKSLGAIYGEK